MILLLKNWASGSKRWIENLKHSTLQIDQQNAEKELMIL